MKSNSTAAPDLTIMVTGMDCASCAQSVEKGVRNLPGVENCQINFSSELLTVSGKISREEVVKRVEALGYGVAETPSVRHLETSLQPDNFFTFMRQRRETVLVLIATVLVFPGLIFNELVPAFQSTNILWDGLSLTAMLLAGTPIAKSAWRSITLAREININVLMTIATIGAVIIGAYSEAGLVIVLFALGEALEGYTTNRARNSIRSLMSIVPQTAVALRPCIDCASHLGQDGYHGGPCPFCGIEPHTLPIGELVIGDHIIVKPGERFPMDGLIVEGSSSVNQAPITGESQLVIKHPGDKVFAGTINGEGSLEVELTNAAEDNTIARLIQMVELAQEKKAPAQRFVDQFAKYYTPAVVLIAVLVAVIPPLIWDAPFFNPSPSEQGWLYRALELLVIACPCALVISTPVSLISAISNAAQKGILIKGGVFLEILSKIKTIAFDKTGTITAGKPRVEYIQSINCTGLETGNCASCDELLAVASAVEYRSEHPLANAIISASKQTGGNSKYPPAASVTSFGGQGIQGTVGENQVFIGSHAYFDTTIPHSIEICNQIRSAEQQGLTPILVSTNDAYAGYIAITDEIRETSPSALKALRLSGVENLIMLTGDHQEVADRIAAQVGITEVKANLLPGEKMTAIEELLEKHKLVAMVGDGINDAPALAIASVGIAMGAAAGGTAQAMETADIVLMGDSLQQLYFAHHLSRAAMRTIWANIILALGIKVVFLILVLFGMGTMWLAVFADMGASILVTLNGMRLLRFNYPPTK